MATVNYLIKNKTDSSTIYVRLKDGRNTDLTCSTGYIINEKYWSIAKNEPKQTSDYSQKLILTKSLKDLKSKILDELNLDKGSIKEIDKLWLQDVINRFKNPSLEKDNDVLINAIKNYQTDLKTRFNPKTEKLISPLTIKNFNTTISRIEKFEAFKNKKYLIHEVDLTFLADYKSFASKPPGKGLGLSLNSISKDFKQIKTVCIDASEKGYSINEQVKSKKFNSPTESTLFVTINELEIEKIKKFKGSDYLENARDWLIIGCWTGCRISDLMQLTKKNIYLSPNGKKIIKYTQSKTGKTVSVPVHEHVNEILDRLNDFPRPISNQRFNDWIKTVCKVAGLLDSIKGTKQNNKTHLKETGYFEKWELIRSHTCRRSFATNHYNKLPNKIIMAVTGHATEKMLLNYIGEIDNDHLTDYWDVWENDKTNNVIDLKRKVK